MPAVVFNSDRRACFSHPAEGAIVRSRMFGRPDNRVITLEVPSLPTAKRYFGRVELDRIIHASPKHNTEDVDGGNLHCSCINTQGMRMTNFLLFAGTGNDQGGSSDCWQKRAVCLDVDQSGTDLLCPLSCPCLPFGNSAILEVPLS